MPRERFQNPQIRKSKNGAYFIRPWIDVVTPDGLKRRKKTIVLGPAEMGKRAALTAKNEVMKTINRADYVVRSQIPFGEMLDRWMSVHVAELGYGTRLKYESQVRNHIRPAFGHLTMLELGTERIQKWLQEKAKAGVCWSTRADLRNILSGVFTRGKEWGLYKDENPVANVKLGRKKLIREKRKLSEDQTRYLLGALHYDLRVMCCVSLFCTLRVSEALDFKRSTSIFKTESSELSSDFTEAISTPRRTRSRAGSCPWDILCMI
jgi:integrase-like protein